MEFKKFFYKITNKKKYQEYKNELSKQKRLKILKSGLEDEISKINNTIKKKKKISFLHSGHLGDIINSLAVIQKLSETHICSLYIQANKPLPFNSRYYKNSKDLFYLDDRGVDMMLSLLKCQPYLESVEKFNNQLIDINLDYFREIPMSFNEDNVRWYSLLTGVHADLSIPYIHVEPNLKFENKVIIIRSTRRKNIFINYKFLKKYDNLVFIGLDHEYLDLKKEVPNLNFYDCKNFLEMAQIIKSSKFFLGNPSLGYVLAEGLKVPRLLENFPEFHKMNPNGANAYDFYFQDHFEKWFDYLYNLKNKT